MGGGDHVRAATEGRPSAGGVRGRIAAGGQSACARRSAGRRRWKSRRKNGGGGCCSRVPVPDFCPQLFPHLKTFQGVGTMRRAASSAWAWRHCAKGARAGAPCWYVISRWGEYVGSGVGGEFGSWFGVGGRAGCHEGCHVNAGLGAGERKGDDGRECCLVKTGFGCRRGGSRGGGGGCSGEVGVWVVKRM
jgi:hypothetical protein